MNIGTKIHKYAENEKILFVKKMAYMQIYNLPNIFIWTFKKN